MSRRRSTLGANEEENPFALSVGDLMAALLLVFVLLLSATLLMVKEDEERTVTIIEEYEALQDSLYSDLLTEFDADLGRWDAELDRATLSLTFKEPDVLFAQGQAAVKPTFAAILSDFFPRYIRILRKPAYRESIEEIRIEGHTSTEWLVGASPDVSYFNNMQLSQDRTRSVLQYALETVGAGDSRDWTRGLVTANGLSSSQPVRRPDGTEDPEASRRVEFRVRTDAERQLRDILDELRNQTANAPPPPSPAQRAPSPTAR